MAHKKKELIKYILSTVLLSAAAGIIVGIAIVLFKFCAGHAVHTSVKIYGLFAEKPLLILPAIAALAVFALGFTLLYKAVPSSRGGGIPTSVGMLRGLLSFKWLINTVAVFFASLVTFIIGVPLGTEGPSVQIGTALGKGVSLGFAKRKPALNRYIMTGGASAGFTVATGSPIAGLLFAIEEGHQRISPLILLSSAMSVVAAKAVSDILSPMLGVSPVLFELHPLKALSVKEFWMPVVIAIVSGLAAVAFLKYYNVLNRLWTKKLKKIPPFVKILSVFLLTLVLGLVSTSFISTGHSLSDVLLETPPALYMLVLCFVIRATVMILASSSGITGGMFLPILALGAVVSSFAASIFVMLGASHETYTLAVALGITASIAGMMKMPVTAMVFAIEALSLSNNILPVMLTVAITYLITEIFGVVSITEKVLEGQLHHLHGDKEASVYGSFVTVKEGAFAAGKMVRDILWPCDLLILSIKRESDGTTHTTDLSETVVKAGDLLYVRYPTYDINATHKELSALIGEQEYIVEKIK